MKDLVIPIGKKYYIGYTRFQHPRCLLIQIIFTIFRCERIRRNNLRKRSEFKSYENGLHMEENEENPASVEPNEPKDILMNSIVHVKAEKSETAVTEL